MVATAPLMGAAALRTVQSTETTRSALLSYGHARPDPTGDRTRGMAGGGAGRWRDSARVVTGAGRGRRAVQRAPDTGKRVGSERGAAAGNRRSGARGVRGGHLRTLERLADECRRELRDRGSRWHVSPPPLAGVNRQRSVLPRLFRKRRQTCAVRASGAGRGNRRRCRGSRHYPVWSPF